MMIKLNYLPLLGILLLAGACKKDLTVTPAPVAAKATKVDELKASETFKWKTSKTMVLNISGLKTLAPISRTLLVSSADGKQVYFKTQQLMSQNSVVTFIMPAKVNEVLVSYGKISKKVSFSGTILQFNYLASN